MGGVQYKCMIFARTRGKSLNLKMERHPMNQRRIKNRWVADIFYERFCLRDCVIIQLGEGGCKEEGALSIVYSSFTPTKHV